MLPRRPLATSQVRPIAMCPRCLACPLLQAAAVHAASELGCCACPSTSIGRTTLQWHWNSRHAPYELWFLKASRSAGRNVDSFPIWGFPVTIDSQAANTKISNMRYGKDKVVVRLTQLITRVNVRQWAVHMHLNTTWLPILSMNMQMPNWGS